ncbi:MAG: hypothetical protein BGO70_05630 [Bacteroidetes bacterium 43-93]|nr:T9SS type A sorting domain-containing protein [Bacteroidota bacterium]OJW96879.1 MAG: hypothetical protein BGO70_05630 [Bacteroidetes bacterium 43-93]
MKKLMLFMAGIAMSLGTHAQFSLDIGACTTHYSRPCAVTGTGYSYTDATTGTFYFANAGCSDVHGALNSSSVYHYSIGNFDNSGTNDTYLLLTDRTSGDILYKYTFDANTLINSGPSGNEESKKMTVDENGHKAYITGTWGAIPFIVCLNIANPSSISKTWGLFLNTYSDINDVTIDASGNVYALVNNSCSGGPCYGNFSILKYSSGGIFLGSWSTSSWGSTDGYNGYAMQYDGSGKIFVAGSIVNFTTGTSGSTLYGIKTNMTFDNMTNLTSYPFNSGGFNKIGRNPTNGHVVTAGAYTTTLGQSSTTWQEWDVTTNPSKSYAPLTPATTPSGLSGISTTYEEFLTDLLVDPNGKVDLVIANITLGNRYLTYINPALNSGLGDIDYSGANAFQFPSTGPYGVWANKDEDGSIVVGGLDGIYPNNIAFTAKFHDASLTTGTGAWPGYENKSTGINNIHADEISIAPNPATDVLSIEGINDNADYRISNTLGQVVTKGSISNSKNAQINVSGLSQGTYYLQLYSADKSVITTKPFVKQ